MRSLWSKKEIEILKELWGKVPIEDLCKILMSRSECAIRRQARTLKLLHYEPAIDLEYYEELMRLKKG